MIFVALETAKIAADIATASGRESAGSAFIETILGEKEFKDIDYKDVCDIIAHCPDEGVVMDLKRYKNDLDAHRHARFVEGVFNGQFDN